MAQVPEIIGEPADHSSQLLGIRVQSAVGAVDHDVGCDELVKVFEPVLVVAAVERGEPVAGHLLKDARAPTTRVQSPNADGSQRRPHALGEGDVGERSAGAAQPAPDTLSTAAGLKCPAAC